MTGLCGDRRGVSEQVGVVLLLGIVVVLLAGYQATVVPQANAGVEFDHDRAARADMQTLRDGIVRAGEGGTDGRVSVAVGTDYPDRIVAVNPPPATGRLAVEPATANLTVSNATAVANATRDYWNGANRSYRTGRVVHRVAYDEYRGAPTLRAYENTVLYETADGGNRTLTGQLLVDGRQVTLLTVRGDYAAAAADVERVPIRATSPRSAAVETVAVRNATGGNLTLRVPTRLTAGEWRELLADEPRVRRVERVGERVAVTLAPGTYELRVARVRIGTAGGRPTARYVTPVGGTRTVEAGEVTELTVAVRDRFDNPVEGVTVNASLVDAGGERVDAAVATGEDGRATLRYRAGVRTGIDRVRLGFANASISRANRSAVFDVEVVGGGRPADLGGIAGQSVAG